LGGALKYQSIRPLGHPLSVLSNSQPTCWRPTCSVVSLQSSTFLD